MPTAYTQDLYEGKEITFEQYAMKCARAFDITMRDEPWDAEITVDTPVPPYYSDRLERAKARVTEVQSWSQQRAATEADKAHAEAVAYREKANKATRERLERYRAMLSQVASWEPPTPDHEGLKTFMGEQILETMRYDKEMPMPAPLGWREYQRDELATAQRNLKYAQTAMDEEINRAKQRVTWLSALKESLEK